MEGLFGMSWQSVASNGLLFLLIAGMAGSCDALELRSKFVSQRRGIVAGIVCQYVVLPLLGFLSLRVWPQDPVVTITLLVLTTSPGGGFSGWWCSLCNADLALSVAMTTASTLACVVFLPLNVWAYASLLTPGMHVQVAWAELLTSVAVVMCAVLVGALTSHQLGNSCSGSVQAVRQVMNTLGSAAGVALMIFGGATNATSSDPLWENSTDWFLCVGSPLVLGLVCAIAIASRLDLEGPSCVAVAIECCYQNTGLALTIALSAVPAAKVGIASGVPIFYGLVEVVAVPAFGLCAWKLGWTYAPASDNVCRALTLNYQPSFHEKSESDAEKQQRPTAMI